MSRSRSTPPGPARPASPQVAADALLGSDAGLPVKRALWLDAMDLQLRPSLPPGLAAHARLANINGGTLVYLVDAPAWHARLRMAAPELLDAARSIGLEVTELTVRVTAQPLHPQPEDRSRMTTVSTPPLTAAAREAFRAALSPAEPEGAGEDSP